MAQLLGAAAERGMTPNYTAKLLAATNTGSHKQVKEERPDKTFTLKPVSQLTIEPLVDHLSERELEILHLIAGGKKNQEIADELFISLNTVRYHTKNLYSKLNVNKCIQAVAKSQQLGLI